MVSKIRNNLKMNAVEELEINIFFFFFFFC